MADTQVSIVAFDTGDVTFYSSYADARAQANAKDLIQIWANLDEQLLLKNGVDIWIATGVVIDVTTAKPTIVDNDSGYTTAVICSIFGNGIIKNSYSGGTKYECIHIFNSGSEISVQCDFLDAIGGNGADTIAAATIKVTDANKFNIVCNNISSHYNTAVLISNCDNILIKCKKILSGTSGVTNVGTPVMSLDGDGFLNIEEVMCNGYGSCLLHKGGALNSTILKLISSASSTSGNPTILLDDGDGSQNLILYFNEIQNLNTTAGDAVKVTEGIANLIGKYIYSNKGFSVELSGTIVSALVQCERIISATKGVNIYNNDEQVIIDASYIEGSNGHYGVIFCDVHANVLLRNAKIKNTYTGSSAPHSIGIFINASSYVQYITTENITIVTGNTSTGKTIYTTTGAEVTTVQNLGLFVNKNIEGDVVLQVGTASNFKYIQSGDIT